MALKIGDRIRLFDIPERLKYCGPEAIEYPFYQEMQEVYRKLIARKRFVRIAYMTFEGDPIFVCRFKNPDGTWKSYDMVISKNDNNFY